MAEVVGGDQMDYTAVIINYNQDKLVSECLATVESQVILPQTILVIDNSGCLGKDSIIRGNVTLVVPGKNMGYAGGCNLALSFCHTEYILVLNPDVKLEPDYVLRLIGYMKECAKIASATGLLLRYDLKAEKPTSIVDSTGICASRSGRFWDRGQGQEWIGQFKTGSVFGVSGAAVFYRTSALRSIDIQGEIFDEDMFVYKEDIDIAWRLSKAGWSAAVVVEAVAYHGRAAGGSEDGRRKHLVQRRRHGLIARRLAFKNQILLLVKNGTNKDVNYWEVALRQIAIFGYVLIFEPKVLGIVPQLIKQLPKAWAKRQYLMCQYERKSNREN